MKRDRRELETLEAPRPQARHLVPGKGSSSAALQRKPGVAHGGAAKRGGNPLLESARIVDFAKTTRGGNTVTINRGLDAGVTLGWRCRIGHELLPIDQVGPRQSIVTQVPMRLEEIRERRDVELVPPMEIEGPIEARILDLQKITETIFRVVIRRGLTSGVVPGWLARLHHDDQVFMIEKVTRSEAEGTLVDRRFEYIRAHRQVTLLPPGTAAINLGTPRTDGSLLNKSQRERAVRLNPRSQARYGWRLEQLGITGLDVDSFAFAERVATMQSAKAITVDGVIGPQTLQAAGVVYGPVNKPG